MSCGGRAGNKRWGDLRSPAGRPAIGGTTRRLSGRARALCRFLSSLFLLHTRAVEGAVHRLISLMTGVFVDLVLGVLHEQRRRPRPGPATGIVDRHFVLQRIGVDAAEPLDEMHLLAGAASTNGGVAAEVRRIDDKRIALVPAHRISQPETHAAL